MRITNIFYRLTKDASNTGSDEQVVTDFNTRDDIGISVNIQPEELYTGKVIKQ